MNETAGRVNQEIKKIEDNVLVEKYKPSFLGMGGEQMVFALEDHPDSVLKVNMQALHRVLELGFIDKDLSEEAKGKVSNFIKKDKERSNLLKQHFGKSYLPERAALVGLPLTKALVAEAFMDHSHLVQKFPEGVHDVSSVVRIQKKAPEEINSTGAETISFRYIERDRLSEDEYELLCKMLIGESVSFEKDQFEKTLSLEGISLVKKIKEDEEFKTIVKDFVEKSITYTEETGEVLDLAGGDNVVFYERGGDAAYTLIDAKYPREGMVELSKGFYEELKQGGELKYWNLLVLANFFNYVRTINGLAILSGSDKRLKLLTEDIAGTAKTFFKMFRKSAEEERQNHR